MRWKHGHTMNRRIGAYASLSFKSHALPFQCCHSMSIMSFECVFNKRHWLWALAILGPCMTAGTSSYRKITTAQGESSTVAKLVIAAPILSSIPMPSQEHVWGKMRQHHCFSVRWKTTAARMAPMGTKEDQPNTQPAKHQRHAKMFFRYTQKSVCVYFEKQHSLTYVTP